MKNTITYKDYIGTVEFSEEDSVFFGKVIGISSLLSYEGATAKEFIEDFHGVVDEYLEDCIQNGIEPEQNQQISESDKEKIISGLNTPVADCLTEDEVSWDNRFKVKDELKPYVRCILIRREICHRFSQDNDQVYCEVQLTNEQFRNILERAYCEKLTEETGILHLTQRESDNVALSHALMKLYGKTSYVIQ